MEESIDFSKLPLAERLEHKVWKARQSGYEELIGLFRRLPEGDEREYRKWTEFIKKAVADANQVAQETGLSAAISFVEYGPPSATVRIKKEVLSSLIEKCFGSARANTKKLASDLLLLYIEVDSADGIMDELIRGAENKNPKIASYSITTLTECFSQFGTKVMEPKPVLKVIGKWSSHSDKTVRAETSKLIVELYRWLGNAINGFLSDLKPVQLKELNDAFQTASKATPQRYLRSMKPSERQTEHIEITTQQDVEQVQEEDHQPDSFDLLDPVKVLNKLPDDFYTRINDSKWKERKEALEQLMELLKPGKFVDDRYGELISSLAKHIDDPNLLVVTLSANAIEQLARGLRMAFSYKSQVVQPMLEKFKEKKQSVVDALSNALDAVFCTTSLGDIVEECNVALNHKNPQVKLQTSKWLTRCFASLKKAPSKSELKNFGDLLVKTADDGANEVREASLVALGTLMKVVGERGLLPWLEKLDKIKETKVREACEVAEVSCRNNVSTPAASKPVVAREPSNTSLKRPDPPTRQPSKPLFKKSKPQVASAAPTVSKKSVKVEAVKEDVVSFQFSDESAISTISESFPDVEKLSDSNWKERHAAIIAFGEKVKGGNMNAEAIVRCLGQKPGWKESNFQVMCEMVKALQSASQLATFSFGCASLAVPTLVEKLGDLKVERPAGDCLISFSEAIGLQKVFGMAYETIRNLKAPKTLAKTLSWIQTSIIEFGIAGLNTRELVDVCKFALSNANPAVRQASVTIIATLSMYLPEVKGLMSDVSPALQHTVEAECAKMNGRTPPPPSRQTRAPIVNVSHPTSTTNSQEDALDSLIPRVDISSQINDVLLGQLSDGNWKMRKEGLDNVAAILQANSRILPNLGDLMSALKHRLGDSNKILVIQTLEVLGDLSIAVGPKFERHMKLIAPSVCVCLQDNKPQVRTAALVTLDKFCQATNFGLVIPLVAPSLSQDNPTLRKELLTWLSTKLDTRASTVADLVGPILICLQDRTAEVRKAAQNLQAPVFEAIGMDVVKERASEIRGSVAPAIQSFLESLKPKEPSSQSGTPRKAPMAPRKALLGKSTEDSEKRNGPPILNSNEQPKLQRAEKDKGLQKWTFEVPRKDLIDLLREQMDPHFGDVKSWLFSEDHNKDKDHVKGLTLLDDALTDNQYAMEWNLQGEMPKRYIAHADLLLKYATIRFFDTNTSITLKTLDLLEHLFTVMDNQGYHMHEYEATCFLPFAVGKLGDAKEAIRARVRQMLRQVCRIYPASKLFNHLLEGLKSKNARTRTECLEEMSLLIQKNGVSVATAPTKQFPIIASQIADRDASVRNAAVALVAQTYQFAQDVVFKWMGKIADKDRAFVDEKLKRMPTGQSPPSTPSAPPPKVIVKPTSVIKPFSLDLDDNVEPSKVSGRVTYDLDVDKDDLLTEDLTGVVQGLNIKSSVSTRMEELIKLLESSPMLDSTRTTNALKEWDDLIRDSPSFTHDKIDSLVRVLANQIRIHCTSPGDALTEIILCAYLNTLAHVFVNVEVASKITRDTLMVLFPEVLKRMGDARWHQGEAGQLIHKYLNAVTFRILENVNHNDVIGALIHLVESGTTLYTSKLSDETEASHLRAYIEMTLKCLWRVYKHLQEWYRTGSLSPDVLFADLDSVFEATPAHEWRRRVANGQPMADVSFRTIKTFIAETGKVFGQQSLEFLPKRLSPGQSYVENYLSHVLETGGKRDAPASPAVKEPVKVNLESERSLGLPENLTRSRNIGDYLEKLAKYQKHVIPTEKPSSLPPLSSQPPEPVKPVTTSISDLRERLTKVKSSMK